MDQKPTNFHAQTFFDAKMKGQDKLAVAVLRKLSVQGIAAQDVFFEVLADRLFSSLSRQTRKQLASSDSFRHQVLDKDFMQLAQTHQRGVRDGQALRAILQ